MLRTSLLLAVAGTLCATLGAQTADSQGGMPLISTPTYGGTYHVATGTWTRTVPNSAALGLNDIVYNNTANNDTWTSNTSEAVVSYPVTDSGRIPSSGSAGTANRNNYNLNGLTFGYCISADAANSADVLITIYGSYLPCTDPSLSTCSGQVLVQGLPGAGATGRCWFIGLDLSGAEVCILGDGDGLFDDDTDFDSFGVSLEFDPGGLGGYIGTGINLGPILAGDRNWTSQTVGEITAAGVGFTSCGLNPPTTGGGGGTYYGPTECCVPTGGGENSSGLDNLDSMFFGDRIINGAPVAPGCFFLGGYNNVNGCNADGGINPAANGGRGYSGLYLMLEADQTSNCVPSDCNPPMMTMVEFCSPANNNTTGFPAVLSGTSGSGVGSDLHLEMTGGVPNQLAYMLAGNEATAGLPITNSPTALCLVGTPTAQLIRFNLPGTLMNSIGGFNASGVWQNAVGTSTTGFGYDVPTTLPTSPMQTTIMSGDTWHFQGWYRDSAAGAGHSNFSNGLSVTFP